MSKLKILKYIFRFCTYVDANQKPFGLSSIALSPLLPNLDRDRLKWRKAGLEMVGGNSIWILVLLKKDLL